MRRNSWKCYFVSMPDIAVGYISAVSVAHSKTLAMKMLLKHGIKVSKIHEDEYTMLRTHRSPELDDKIKPYQNYDIHDLSPEQEKELHDLGLSTGDDEDTQYFSSSIRRREYEEGYI